MLTFLLILAACAAPTKDLSASPQTEPPLETEPAIIPAESTAAPSVNVTFEESLLAVEWQGRSKGNLLFPLDPTSGTALPDYAPISLGQSYFHAFSPDRRKLAAVIFPNENMYRGDLLLIDLPSWKTQTFELKTSGWVSAMVFSPDGTRLAIAQGEINYDLSIFDVEQAVITAQAEEDSLITHMKFTADSESLMLYGLVIQNRYTENETNSAPQVKLLDAANLNPLWSVELEGVRDGIYPKDEKVAVDYSQPGTAVYFSPAIIFSPAQNILYIIHADSEQLTIANFDSQEFKTLEIQSELSWFERLLSLTAGVAHAKVADGTGKQAAISPDGRLLYVVGMRSESVQSKNGNLDMNQIPLGLEIIRTSDGSRLEHLETDSADLSLSPDGRFIYLRNWTNTTPWTETFDISNHQIISHQDEIYAMPALRMNGEFLLVSTYSVSDTSHHISIFEPDGFKMLTEWTGKNYFAWLTP